MNLRRRQLLMASAAGITFPVLSACGVDKTPAPGVPRSEFDEDATAEQVTTGLDLTGKHAIVTGCTSGIGFETMRVLALRGAYVVGTSRSLQRAEDACKRVVGVTSPVELRLSDPESIVECADKIRASGKPIDMLVCNAGVLGGSGGAQTVNGIERHFAINHLGHFLFVNRLLDRLYTAWQGRIVVVASRSSYTAVPPEGIRLDDLTLGNDYSDRLAYGQSKLANVLFANGLARRLVGTRITANSLHPGVINTEIDRDLGRLTQFGFKLLTALTGKTIEEGAATSCYVATSPLLGTTSGRYFEDCNAVSVAGSHHDDHALANQLWDASEAMMRDYLVTHTRPDDEVRSR